jgi:hypothetical protein
LYTYQKIVVLSIFSLSKLNPPLRKELKDPDKYPPSDTEPESSGGAQSEAQPIANQ